MTSISTQIFDEVLTTVEAIGTDRTIKALQKAKSDSLILENFNVDFILSSVTEVTGVSRERILHGNDRTDERKQALALCIFFIKNEFEYSLSDIGRIFEKEKSGLSRYNKMVENMPEKPKTPFDKKLDTHVRKIKLLITEKKLK